MKKFTLFLFFTLLTTVFGKSGNPDVQGHRSIQLVFGQKPG